MREAAGFAEFIEGGFKLLVVEPRAEFLIRHIELLKPDVALLLDGDIFQPMHGYVVNISVAAERRNIIHALHCSERVRGYLYFVGVLR